MFTEYKIFYISTTIYMSAFYFIRNLKSIKYNIYILIFLLSYSFYLPVWPVDYYYDKLRLFVRVPTDNSSLSIQFDKYYY